MAIKKDIYIITNDINNKIYIGQAKNTGIRWTQHKCNANSGCAIIFIDKMMAQLGVEHFNCEILEHQIENYDEREQYWINYYDCIDPKGYNRAKGGEGCLPGVDCPVASIKDQKIIDGIIKDLLEEQLSLPEIAEKYETTLKLVSSVNRGTSYVQNKFSYPIRKRAADLVDEIDIENLWKDIINTKKSRGTLAKEYDTSIYIIDQIIKGEKWYNDKFTYPLRKVLLTEAEVQNIIDMIKNTSFSLREIARRCNTSYSTVAHINSGKYHHRENQTYPIRVS